MPHYSDQPPVIVQEITQTSELEKLEPEWWDLWRRDRASTPFQSPAWLLPWWRHIGKGELLTLAIRSRKMIDRANPLVGLLPLYIYTQPENSSRDLLPLGIATTDYLDGVFAPGWESCALSAAMEYLAAQSNRWDLLDFHRLGPHSACLAAALPAAWTAEVTEDEPCLTLALPASAAEFHACASAHLMHNLHYYRKRADKLGDLRIEQANDQSWNDIFSAMLDLHRARWNTRGENGCLADDGVERAHRESIPQLLHGQMLRLYALHLDHQIIGTLYGLVDPPESRDRRFYYYLGGFDPHFDQISPGTLLIGYAVEHAIRDRINTFDFLRGQEAYKYLWGAHDSKTYRRRLRHSAAPLDEFEIRSRGVIRPCRIDDLPTLEWFGLFSHQRELLRNQFERHQRGESIMLVAEVNGVASGQAWIDLARQNVDSTAVIWAIRVFPTLQRKGIGSRLITAAEEILRARGFEFAELSVDESNESARRLYERLGYSLVESTSINQSLLRKPLRPQTGARHFSATVTSSKPGDPRC